jgi:hypothetical protein
MYSNSVSTTEKSGLKVQFQISIFCDLQKCTVDSAQDKPANPILAKGILNQRRDRLDISTLANHPNLKSQSNILLDHGSSQDSNPTITTHSEKGQSLLLWHLDFRSEKTLPSRYKYPAREECTNKRGFKVKTATLLPQPVQKFSYYGILVSDRKRLDHHATSILQERSVLTSMGSKSRQQPYYHNPFRKAPKFHCPTTKQLSRPLWRY